MGAWWLPVGWLGERWSGRVPGWAQMLDRAGVRWRRSGRVAVGDTLGCPVITGWVDG